MLDFCSYLSYFEATGPFQLSKIFSVACMSCVAWRFCRMHKCTAGWPSRKSARERAPAPISSQFNCPRPTWLVCLADQNRHATQAMLSVKHLRLRNLSAKAYRHIGCKINGLTLSLDDATDISQDIHHLVSAASLYDPRVTKFLTSSTPGWPSLIS